MSNRDDAHTTTEEERLLAQREAERDESYTRTLSRKEARRDEDIERLRELLAATDVPVDCHVFLYDLLEWFLKNPDAVLTLRQRMAIRRVEWMRMQIATGKATYEASLSRERERAARPKPDGHLASWMRDRSLLPKEPPGGKRLNDHGKKAP